jgi:alkylation response protein AidB-like acyl-CoA dehydrogenase
VGQRLTLEPHVPPTAPTCRSESATYHRGRDAWNAALNTVNIGKYNLGWASIGICTHALYEAITHANNRVLYGQPGHRHIARA